MPNYPQYSIRQDGTWWSIIIIRPGSYALPLPTTQYATREAAQRGVLALLGSWR